MSVFVEKWTTQSQAWQDAAIHNIRIKFVKIYFFEK